MINLNKTYVENILNETNTHYSKIIERFLETSEFDEKYNALIDSQFIYDITLLCFLRLVDADKVKDDVIEEWPAIKSSVKKFSPAKNKHLFIKYDSINKSISHLKDRIDYLLGKLSFDNAVKIIRHIGFDNVVKYSLDEINEIELILRKLYEIKNQKHNGI